MRRLAARRRMGGAPSPALARAPLDGRSDASALRGGIATAEPNGPNRDLP